MVFAHYTPKVISKILTVGFQLGSSRYGCRLYSGRNVTGRGHDLYQAAVQCLHFHNDHDITALIEDYTKVSKYWLPEVKYQEEILQFDFRLVGAQLTYFSDHYGPWHAARERISVTVNTATCQKQRKLQKCLYMYMHTIGSLVYSEQRCSLLTFCPEFHRLQEKQKFCLFGYQLQNIFRYSNAYECKRII